jgi:hypothetical protein
MNEKGSCQHYLADAMITIMFEYYERDRLAEDERSGRHFSLILETIMKPSICNCLYLAPCSIRLQEKKLIFAPKIGRMGRAAAALEHQFNNQKVQRQS